MPANGRTVGASEPAANFSTRLWSASTTYTLPAASTATSATPCKFVNGSTVGVSAPAASFGTRLRSKSPTYTSPNVSTAIQPMSLTGLNGSTVGAFDPAADFTTWTAMQHPPSEYTAPPLAPQTLSAVSTAMTSPRPPRSGNGSTVGVPDPAASLITRVIASGNPLSSSN